MPAKPAALELTEANINGSSQHLEPVAGEQESGIGDYEVAGIGKKVSTAVEGTHGHLHPLIRREPNGLVEAATDR